MCRNGPGPRRGTQVGPDRGRDGARPLPPQVSFVASAEGRIAAEFRSEACFGDNTARTLSQTFTPGWGHRLKLRHHCGERCLGYRVTSKTGRRSERTRDAVRELRNIVSPRRNDVPITTRSKPVVRVTRRISISGREFVTLTPFTGTPFRLPSRRASSRSDKPCRRARPRSH